MKKKDLLNEDVVVINLGLENFAYSLRDQGVEVEEIDWSPPAENDRVISNLLDELL